MTGIAAEELEELRDVRGLKQRLKESHGLASRFRQRLLSDGESLAETARLDAPMDLCLVLLPFVEVSPSQADNLAAAAWRGSTAEVESMLQLPVDPDLTNKDGRTALMMASRGGHVRHRLLAVGGWRQQGCERHRLAHSFDGLVHHGSCRNRPLAVGIQCREGLGRQGRVHGVDEGIWRRSCRMPAPAVRGWR